MPLTFSAPVRLSPSQYFRASTCPYQLLLARTTEAQALPGVAGSGGAAAVGTIVHGVLEQAATADLSTAAAFEGAWQTQLAHKEASLLRDGAGHLLPLVYRARGYAVTKLLLRWYLAKYQAPAVPPPGSALPLGPEQRLADDSGTVTGVADLIRLGVGGPEILDYKTGPIFSSNGEMKAEIKPAYAQQLQLYAALFYEQTKTWPTRLLLADLAGNEHEVSFTEIDCLRLLNSARELLSQMQAAVAANEPAHLAIPGIEQCRYCQVRALCSPFEAWAAQLGE